MAKRNIRKTDPDTVSTPDSREASTADTNGRASAPKPSRSRRKADAPVAAAAPQPGRAADVTPITAEGGIETATLTQASRVEDQPRTAASSFTTVAEVAAVELSHDQIAERAYHLYLERDRQPGDPFADWLTAERELRERFVGA
jgi:Protein of unknown function (DUF2934)